MSVWIKQLPREWKKIFDDAAFERGDTAEHGRGARLVEKVLREWLIEKGLVVK